VWAGSFAVRTGGHVVGVRVDDPRMLAFLRNLFEPWLVDTEDAPPYLSAQRNSAHGVPLLFEGGCRVLRTRDSVRLVSGVMARVCELGGAPPTPGHVRVKGTAIVGPDGAVLLPASRRTVVDDARIAEARGVEHRRIFIVEDGDTVVLRDGKVRRGDRVPAGLVLVDGLGVGDVGPVVLRDRHHLAEDGVLICVVTIDAQNGDILAGPDLISRGFVHVEEARDFLDDAGDRVADALEDMQPELVTDWGAIKKVCRRTLGEFVWQNTRRRPMILPIIMEV
jgi:hypothetical protein